MPRKPLHPCGHRGCAALTAGRWCAEHARKAAKADEECRGTATERGYDGNWSRVRRMKLACDPLCERCQARGEVVPAALVHHRDRQPRNNEWVNLESLCEACHDREHKGERFHR